MSIDNRKDSHSIVTPMEIAKQIAQSQGYDYDSSGVDNKKDSGLAGAGYVDDDYDEFSDHSMFDTAKSPMIQDEFDDNSVFDNLSGSTVIVDDEDFGIQDGDPDGIFDFAESIGKPAMPKDNPWIDVTGSRIAPTDKEVAWLNSKLDIYAGNYNRETSLIVEEDLYNVRKAATREALLDWVSHDVPQIPILSSITGQSKAGPNGDILNQDMTVPLPNELNIKGLVFTAAIGTNARGMNSGSPNTRQSYHDMFPTSAEVTNADGNYDRRAYLETKVGRLKPHQLELLAPSLTQTFFPHMGDAGAIEMKAMESDFERMRGIAGAMSPPVPVPTKDYSGSQYDYTRLAAGMKATAEGMSPLVRGYDSYVNLDGQPADRSLSEVGMFVNRALAGQDAGLSIDEVYAQVDDLYDIDDIVYRADADVDVTGAAPYYVPDGSDRDIYRKRVADGLESGKYYEQRTPEWHEQRRGLKTGSAVGSIHTPGGQERIAQDFANKARNKEDLDVLDAMIANAEVNLDMAETKPERYAAKELLDEAVDLRREFALKPTYEDRPFSSNYYMAQGTEFENSVERSFENFSGMKVEEAYFETNPDYEGYGVSPDGFVFDQEGNSNGIAEFKMHNNEAGMLKSMKTYSHQLQLQMMVTGQESVHFYRMNMESSKVMYDIVKRDQKVIDKILKGGIAVDKLQEDIMSRTADVRDLPEGAAEAMAEMTRQRQEEADRLKEIREGKKHDGFIEQIPKKTPDHVGYEADRSTALDGKNSKPKALKNLFSSGTAKASSIDPDKASRNAMSTQSISVSSDIETYASGTSATKDKQTVRESQASQRGDDYRTATEEKALRKQQEADGAYYDIRYKHETAYKKLHIASIKENAKFDKARHDKIKEYDKTEYFARKENEKQDAKAKAATAAKFDRGMAKGLGALTSALKTLGGLNKSGAKNAMGVANAAAEVGMDGDRALGQIDAVSTAGNMSFEDSATLVFGGAALQNEASGGINGVESFMGKQRNAITAAALNGTSLDVLGIAEIRDMKPGDLLPKIMKNTEHMDKTTRAKVYKAFGLSGASRVGDRLQADFLQVASKDLNETVLRGKDLLTREEDAKHREIEYDMMASTPDEVMRVAARADFVTRNKPAAVYSAVTQAGEAVSDGVSEVGNAISDKFSRIRATPFNDGNAFGSLGSAGSPVPSKNFDAEVKHASLLPSQKISAISSMPNSGSNSNVNVNSKLEVSINEETIESKLVDDFGHTAVSTQPRNGGM